MHNHTSQIHTHTDCTSCLTRLVDDDPLPAAIVIGGVITHANAMLAEVFYRNLPTLYGRSLEDILQGIGLTEMLNKALLTRRRQTLERQVKLQISEEREEEAALWFRASPVGMTPGVILLHVADRTAQIHMQISFLKDMRQSRSDTIWILDTNYRVAYVDFNPLLKRVKHGLLQHAMHKDAGKLLSLLTKQSRTDFRFLLLQARYKPDTMFSATLELKQQIRKHRTVFADVIYLRDTFAGGHFYLCTRPEYIDNNDVIARLRIVYDVPNDAGLARALGVDRSRITEAKNDVWPPSDWVMRAFVEKHYSMDWVMTGKPPIKSR